VVNIKEVESMKGVRVTSQGVTIGAVTRLDEVLESPELDEFPAIKQVIRNLGSMQLQCQSTLSGELCQRPACWYFRSGNGLLARAGKLVAEGSNRYHAIFGNSGPAKFVSASHLAPALIALDAMVRIIGPKEQELFLPLAEFYRTPRDERQRETVLEPNQVLTHVHIPATGLHNGAYEVRQTEGPDAPLCAAAAALRIGGGIVTEAQVVLGQVAPTPWISPEAARAIIGKPVTPETARAAGEAAVVAATPLSENRYKVQLAKVSVERAILLAAGLETGGF
jgi:xanthine dehydrogenase YagS FAD-binding subunit